MFAPLVEPFLLTCVIVPLLAIGLWVALKRRDVNKLKSIVFASVILFVPSCVGIAFVFDEVRYGEFQFKKANEISDPYVKIPADATAITLHKYASGHAVKFTVDEKSLLKWMDDVAAGRNPYGEPISFEIADDWGDPQGWFDLKFGQYGWTAPQDVVHYDGRHSDRGAGFDVWYSPSTRSGFIPASYW